MVFTWRKLKLKLSLKHADDEQSNDTYNIKNLDKGKKTLVKEVFK